MSRYNKYKEFADKLREICIDHEITIMIVEYPFKNKYYLNEHLFIDSIPPFKT